MSTVRNPMDMTGRCVLVTGASGDLGGAIAVRLAELGASVVAAGRRREKLDALADRMPGRGHTLETIDLSDLTAIRPWLASVAERVGPMSGLVHSAGVHRLLPLQVAGPEKVEELMKINFAAAVELTRAFQRKRVAARPASVVYVASIMGLIGSPGVAAYSASKGALVAVARTLALELADRKIRVNCVCPGVVATKLADEANQSLLDDHVRSIHAKHPLGLGEPEDVANATAFLLSDAGRWITGQSVVVDGGYTAA